MPHEFPHDELEAMAKEMDLTANDWRRGVGSKRAEIAKKWQRKAAVVREAIDAYRESTGQAPKTRRQQFAEIIESVSEQRDFRKAASGDK